MQILALLSCCFFSLNNCISFSQRKDAKSTGDVCLNLVFLSLDGELCAARYFNTLLFAKVSLFFVSKPNNINKMASFVGQFFKKYCNI